MALHKAVQKLNRDVDSYMESLNYDKLCKTRDIYGMIYSDLSKLTLKNFEETNPLDSIELGIVKMDGMVEISGYIRIATGGQLYTFINIDMRYERRKVTR
jgi:hypothetical protein